jgi:hypothetical protein
MTKLKFAFGLLTLTAAGPSMLPGAAHALTYHGVQCNPIKSDVTTIEYNEWGVHNTGTSLPDAVWCGAAVPRTLSGGGTVVVNVYDRHATRDVCCTARIQDGAGEVWSSGLRCTPPGFFGSGVTTIDISLNPWRRGTASIVCTIPPATTNGVSVITSYTLSD